MDSHHIIFSMNGTFRGNIESIFISTKISLTSSIALENYVSLNCLKNSINIITSFIAISRSMSFYCKSLLTKFTVYSVLAWALGIRTKMEFGFGLQDCRLPIANWSVCKNGPPCKKVKQFTTSIVLLLIKYEPFGFQATYILNLSTFPHTHKYR